MPNGQVTVYTVHTISETIIYFIQNYYYYYYMSNGHVIASAFKYIDNLVAYASY